MTQEDIIKTAFKVWGRTLYQKTSLTEIASELKVSKPALYRHFKDKEALLDAMYQTFFDSFAASIKESYDRAIASGDGEKSFRIMMRSVAEYYIRNRDAFTFSLMRVHNNRVKGNASYDFRIRGIDFARLPHEDSNSSFYPSKLQLIIVTIIFHIAHFHHGENASQDIPSEEQARELFAQIEERVEKGLTLDPGKVSTLDYEGLEGQAARSMPVDTGNNALLKAVAEAVAEAGPWDASMERVAKLSGLSKSGLYAHFKNKQDMLTQLFVSEFTQIVNFAREQIEKSTIPEEQLYLGIISIVNYLRLRPEIFLAIDSIKTRHLELGKELPNRLYRIIKSIELEAIQKYDLRLLVWVAQWILFLIINTLAWWPRKEGPGADGPMTGSPGTDKCEASPCPGISASRDLAKNVVNVPNESFRILFKFIALGLEGLNDQ